MQELFLGLVFLSLIIVILFSAMMGALICLAVVQIVMELLRWVRGRFPLNRFSHDARVH